MSPKRKRAILISFCEDNTGCHLRLDDVVQQENQPKTWIQDVFITSKQITKDELDSLKFEEKEFADFGHYVFSRLRAFLKQGEL